MDLCRRLASLRGCRKHCISPSTLMGPSSRSPPQLEEGRTVKTSFPSAEDLRRISHGSRTFSSLITKWQSSKVQEISDLRLHHHHHHLFLHHQKQQVRHVYVEVIDNDIDAAVKVYRKKMLNTKIEDKLREKRYYSKPSERRKLAKHYKKLNRARRELTAKIRTVKHRMEKIQEVRKIEKEEKRAKAAAAAAASASQGPKANGR